MVSYGTGFQQKTVSWPLTIPPSFKVCWWVLLHCGPKNIHRSQGQGGNHSYHYSLKTGHNILLLFRRDRLEVVFQAMFLSPSISLLEFPLKCTLGFGWVLKSTPNDCQILGRFFDLNLISQLPQNLRFMDFELNKKSESVVINKIKYPPSTKKWTIFCTRFACTNFFIHFPNEIMRTHLWNGELSSLHEHFEFIKEPSDVFSIRGPFDSY